MTPWDYSRADVFFAEAKHAELRRLAGELHDAGTSEAALDLCCQIRQIADEWQALVRDRQEMDNAQAREEHETAIPPIGA